jgi:hypothetical protein
MCTVTFIPSRGKVFFTSNRDEKHHRSDAIPPVIYSSETGKLIYPRDGDAGGTWIALHENGNALIFLNGGLVPHVPNPPYRKSRGLVLLDLISQSRPYTTFLTAGLEGIEPFTAILFEYGQLFECRWDGKKKIYRQLNEGEPHIWSSVTLYDETVIRKRETWFRTWISRHPSPGMADIMHFHQFTGDGDRHNDLLMNRGGQVFTVSITGMELGPRGGFMQYLDIRNRLEYTQELIFQKLTLTD